MENKILIEKKYLIFRDEAKKLAQKIKKSKLKKVFIDFSQVIFMSRSFIDEFLNQMRTLERKAVKVKFLNLNPNLLKFILKVKKIKRKIEKKTLFKIKEPGSLKRKLN